MKILGFLAICVGAVFFTGAVVASMIVLTVIR